MPRNTLAATSSPLRTNSIAKQLRDWPESAKPSRHDAAKFLAKSLLLLTNDHSRKVHFTLNQDTSSRPALGVGWFAFTAGVVRGDACILPNQRSAFARRGPMKAGALAVGVERGEGQRWRAGGRSVALLLRRLALGLAACFRFRFLTPGCRPLGAGR